MNLDAEVVRPAPAGRNPQPAPKNLQRHSSRPIDFPRALRFLLFTVATLVIVPWYGATYGYAALDWALFAFFYGVSSLGITVGYHRLITHRSFQCPNAVKKLLLVAGGWAIQNSALRWAADHARHHARIDTEEDPYDGRRGFWYSHWGWFFRKDPHYTERYAPWLRKDPVVLWQQRWFGAIQTSSFLLPPLIGLGFGGVERAVACFLLAGAARVFLVLNVTFCINSVCHIWGNQPYSQTNTSRNNVWVALVTFGEGYHNYHHSYPNDYRNGARWQDFDPSKWLIFTLSKLGLAHHLIRLRARARVLSGEMNS